MRCIDADELLKKPLDMANYPSSFVRAEPTLKVVPIDKLEELKAELPDHSFWQDAGGEPLVAIRDVLELIDRKANEVNSKDCRDCKKWNDCECGKNGHDKGTSIGYSVGECAEYEVTKDE